jgi:hypothetical protein
MTMTIRRLKACVKRCAHVVTMAIGACFRSARSLQRGTEGWRAVDSPGVRVMRGMLIASVRCDRQVVPTFSIGSCLIGLAPTIISSGRILHNVVTQHISENI